ncbi:MAG: isochorismate synthase [Polyangiaceae bacterium]
MSFERALADAVQRAERARPDQLIVIGGAASPSDIKHAAHMPAPILWDSSRSLGGDGVRFEAWGSAAVVQANGDSRFEHVRARAHALLADAWVIGDAEPRFVGGFAFSAGRRGAFTAFGDARFVLPRWSAAPGHLQLTARASELWKSSNLVSELGQAPAGATARGGGATQESNGISAFRLAATEALSRIGAGTLEKVVVVRESKLAGACSLRDAWPRLETESAPVHFAISSGEHTFLGASPELLVAFDGQALKTEAIAGTAARRGNELEETEGLLASEKDGREHAFVVEAIMEALRARGAVSITALSRHVRTLRNVHHLATPILASAPTTHVLDWVAALHPTPAVCGVPRKAALQFIAEQEPFERGWFAAPVGWFDLQGRGQFCVALRSALLTPNETHLFAGAGLVQGSEVDAELAETEAKFASMRRALGFDESATAHTTAQQRSAP